MLKLLGASQTTIEATPAQTLDQLWHEAEQLGQIEIDHKTFSNNAYRVRINFQRRSGTRIWAEGNDANIYFAISKAIQEARELGAGVAQ
jgi:ribosome-associated translation inhibitor RaiA